jgi:hypothetical protein
MENASKMASVIDDFEAQHGEIPTDNSERLRKARYHLSAYDQFVDALKIETDEDEMDHLRDLIKFHKERLTLLLDQN